MPEAVTPEALYLPPTHAVDITDAMNEAGRKADTEATEHLTPQRTAIRYIIGGLSTVLG